MTRLARLVSTLAVAASAACATYSPRPVPAPTPTVTPAPAVTVLTVKVIGPDLAFVKVTGSSRREGEWATRTDRTIVEEFSAGDTLTIVTRADGYVTDRRVVTALPGPMEETVTLARVPVTATIKWPAVGASYYSAFTDERVDLQRYARFLEEVGATFTRTFLFDAWATGQRDGTGKFLPGMHDGYLPVERLPDGRYDLTRWNPAYFRHLRDFVDTMNQHGVFVHVTILELYSWSDRKSILPFVPDPNLGPYRNNVNGVRWGGPDDPTFFALPDTFLNQLVCKVVDTLSGSVWLPQVGNEMPEKELHERIVKALRDCGWRGPVTVNRNEDTPGQYWNMQIDKGRYDLIEIHGKMNIGYLDEDFPEEGPAGRPRTFREFWPLVDASKVIMSSDGGSSDPRRFPELKVVACDTLRRGASYELQMTLKRNLFFGDGSFRMDDLEIDRPFLASLKDCRR